MNLLNTKIMLGIASVALGISLMISTYTFFSEKPQTEPEVAVTEDTEPEVVFLAEETPFLNKCMVTNVEDFASVYTVPSKGGEVVGKMYIGACADVILKDTEWTLISSGTVVGYVNNEYLAYDKDAEEVAERDCKSIAIVTADALNVRKAADTDSGVLGLVYKKDNYEVLGEEDGWVIIQYSGEDAFISEEYVKITQKVGSAISLEEEAAAIAAEEARLAAIAAEEARKKAEQEAQMKAKVEGAQFADVLSTSPYSQVTEEGAYLIACVVDCESGYEPYEGRLAVANILLNRLVGGRYGNTVSSVVYAQNQFSVVGQVLTNKMINGPSKTSIKATKEALLGVNNVPQFTNFCSYRIATTDKYKEWTQIGNHIFYRWK